MAKNANNTLSVHVKSGISPTDGAVCSAEEEELVIADVKRQSVLMMQVKQMGDQTTEMTTDGGTTAAEAPQPDVVSMETGESQKQEEVKVTQETRNTEPADTENVEKSVAESVLKCGM